MVKKVLLLAAVVATQPACVETVALAVLLDNDVERPPSKFEREECERILAAPESGVPGCAECGTQGGDADPRRAACVQLFERHERWKAEWRAMEQEAKSGAPPSNSAE